jgi:uncharacterized protein YbaR (Trm112 family)
MGEELKAKEKKIIDSAVEMVCSPDYPANMLEVLTKRLETKNELSTQKKVFWDEVHAKLSIAEDDSIALVKDWAIHYLFPVCGECKERHPVMDGTPAMVLEVIMG